MDDAYKIQALTQQLNLQIDLNTHLQLQIKKLEDQLSDALLTIDTIVGAK